MSKLIMTRGLPASGKTTWAQRTQEQYIKEGKTCAIVCKDDIRENLASQGWTWSREGEKQVIALRDSLITGYLQDGVDLVISADTNFGKHKHDLKALADKHGAEFSVKDFTKVPLEVCLDRDAKRVNSVGPKVIKDMYNKYLALPEIVPYTPNAALAKAIICDLDGTLALHVDRSPYDYNKCNTDKVNTPIANLLNIYASQDYRILYVSGREDSARNMTSEWIMSNNLPDSLLFMRCAGDHRKDYIIKLEIFNQFIRNYYNVDFVLDDRDQVVKMWRELGLTCLQVNYGDF